MTKGCKKVKFDLARVTMVLGFIKKKGEREEKRYYKCDICGSYHLTKMSEGKYDKKKELSKKFSKEKKERAEWYKRLNL